MREIKFRAWDTKNNKWAFKDFTLLGEVMLFDLLSQYKLENHCDLLIEQYTGLKDKNGTEIYEGDIVKGKWICRDIERESTFLVDGHWPFYEEVGESSGYLYETSIYPEDFEIIGNIHENPELVK